MKLFQVALFLLWANNSFALSNDFLPVPADHVVRHRYYTLSFNEPYEQANWVYYSLTDSMVVNSGEERSNSFKMDKLIATESAKSSDYSRSGYDRGHLCPAADMGFNPVAMRESFLMSNVSPQVPEFNRGMWKELEMTIREWAKKERKLYIVTGPVFKDNKGIIGQEEVLVPGYFFKVIYDPTDRPKIIAFVMPNKAIDGSLTEYAVPADEAEKLTGYDFFSQLPDDQETRLEGKVQLAGWFEGYAEEKVPEVAAEKTPETKQKTPDATITKDKKKEGEKRAPLNINLVLVVLFVLFVIVVLILLFMLNSKKKR